MSIIKRAEISSNINQELGYFCFRFLLSVVHTYIHEYHFLFIINILYKYNIYDMI